MIKIVVKHLGYGIFVYRDFCIVMSNDESAFDVVVNSEYLNAEVVAGWRWYKSRTLLVSNFSAASVLDYEKSLSEDNKKQLFNASKESIGYDMSEETKYLMENSSAGLSTRNTLIYEDLIKGKCTYSKLMLYLSRNIDSDKVLGKNWSRYIYQRYWEHVTKSDRSSYLHDHRMNIHVTKNTRTDYGDLVAIEIKDNKIVTKLFGYKVCILYSLCSTRLKDDTYLCEITCISPEEGIAYVTYIHAFNNGRLSQEHKEKILAANPQKEGQRVLEVGEDPRHVSPFGMANKIISF